MTEECQSNQGYFLMRFRDAWRTPHTSPQDLSWDPLRYCWSDNGREVGSEHEEVLIYLKALGSSVKLPRQLCGLNRLSVLGKWRHWESPEIPSLASVPPESLTLSSEQDIKSHCLSWLCPAPWFLFFVSVLQCVDSFPSLEHYCFFDSNSHPPNLSNRAFVSLFTFLIIYVFPLPKAWRHLIPTEVTAWGKAKATAASLFWVETCSCTKRGKEKVAHIWRKKLE